VLQADLVIFIDRDRMAAQQTFDMMDLWCACHCADVEVAGALLARGVDANLGGPCIFAACMMPTQAEQANMDMSTFWARRLQVVRLLADHNADLSITDRDGKTPVMYASQHYEAAAIVTLLCSEHVDLNLLDNNNKSALWVACYNANVSATVVLLLQGAHVNLGDKPILAACKLPLPNDIDRIDMSSLWHRRYYIVAELIEYDVDLTVVTTYGDDPLHLAQANSQWEILHLLRGAVGYWDDEEVDDY